MNNPAGASKPDFEPAIGVKENGATVIKIGGIPAGSIPPPINQDAARSPLRKSRDVWAAELYKFLDREVEVAYVIGLREVTVTGKLRTFSVEGHHIVIDTTDEAIFVRYPLSIRRRRTHAATAAPTGVQV